MKNKITLGIAAIALTFTAACGGGGDATSPERIAWFEEQGETTAAATCFAEELADYSVDELNEAFIVSAEGPSDDLAADVEAAAGKCEEL